MSRDRKASLIWWVTMIALFTVLSTVGMYIEGTRSRRAHQALSPVW